MMKMEVFHTACTMLSITGKRLQDAGLRNLCVESGVIAEGSVAEVLQGRRLNSCVRLHKLVHEAPMRLAWRGFRPCPRVSLMAYLVRLVICMMISAKGCSRSI